MRAVIAAIMILTAAGRAPAADWPMFGWDVGRTSAPPVSMGVSAEAVSSLQRQRVPIDGTVDSPVIYLGGVTVGGGVHDAFFMTTTYGKTLAMDADSGAVLWEYTPESYTE